jgi:hypothetical protein
MVGLDQRKIINMRKATLLTIRKAALISSISILLGCSVGEIATIESVKDGTSIISKTAANKGMVIHKIGENVVVCDSMSSDSTTNTSFDTSFSLVGGSKDETQDGVTETELTGRTPQLLGLRDSMYSACLMYVSGALNKNEYSLLASKLLLKYADNFSSLTPTSYELKIHQNVQQSGDDKSGNDDNNNDNNDNNDDSDKNDNEPDSN